VTKKRLRQLSTTVHHVTDTHIGSASSPQSVTDDLLVDFAVASPGRVDGIVHTGDIIANAANGHDADARHWLAEAAAGKPSLCIPGNHDFRNRGAGTLAEWEDAYGHPGNVAVDIGSHRFLAVSPDKCAFHGGAETGPDPWVIPSETLDWARRLIRRSRKPIVLVTHFPPRELGAKAWVEPHEGLTELVSTHSRVVGWLAGHLHWDIADQRMTSLLTFGDRSNVPVICGPATRLAVRSGSVRRRPRSLYLTIRERRWDVRYRLHDDRKWGGPDGYRVTVLDLAKGEVRRTYANRGTRPGDRALFASSPLRDGTGGGRTAPRTCRAAVRGARVRPRFRRFEFRHR
jgi:hypothetical protein